MEFHYHHCGVSVPDLDEAIAWYGRVLGFTVERRYPIASIPAEIAVLRNGDLHFELFAVPGAAALPPDRREPDRDVHTHGNKHVAFTVADADACAAELRRRGADIVWERRTPQFANLFLRDHAGNLIEFVEKALPEGRPGQL